MVSRTFDTTTGWQDAAVTGSAASISNPRRASDGIGGAIAVWSQREQAGQFNSIFASRFNSQGGWTPPYRLGDLTGDASGPVLSMDAHGRATVLWYQWIGDLLAGTDVTTLYVARYK